MSQNPARRLALHHSLLLLALLPASIAAQESACRFDAPIVVGGTQDRFRAIVDMDGDGSPDVISAWWTPNATGSYQVTFRGWRNDGGGTLSVGWSLPFAYVSSTSPEFPIKVTPANIDGDALEDFIFSSGAGLYWLQSTGGQTSPAIPTGALVTGLVESIVTPDLNADGLDDVVCVTHNSVLFVFLTGPGPSQVQASTLPLAGPGPRHLAVADVNGDGSPDVVVAAKSANSTLTFVPIIGGVAQPGGTVFTLPGVAAPMLTAGDVDGDGDRDLVVFGMMPNQVTVVRCVGPGSFVQEAPAPGGPATDLFDLDGDGDLDGLCCGGGGGGGGGGGNPVVHNTMPSTFEFCANDGTGSFGPSFTMPGLGSERAAGAADLDGDGDLDWVAGRCVYYFRGAATLPPWPTGITDPPARTFADLDSDGDPDLLDQLAAVAANDGHGIFASDSVVLPPPPAGLTFGAAGVPGDFDGDGDVDLVFETWSGTTWVADRLLKNAGGGGFTDAGLAAAAGQRLGNWGFSPPIILSPANSLTGDLDADGDLDLVVRSHGSPAASVLWFNDGAGHFSGPQVLVATFVHAIRDVNHDGFADLVAFANASSALGWRAGLGGGAFATTFTAWATGVDQTTAPAIADLDGNGSDDVLVIRVPGVAAIHRLNAAGTVSSIQPLPVATPPIGAPGATAVVHRGFVADLDGDAWLDLVYGPVDNAQNAVAILQGTGPTTYAPPSIQVLSPTGIVDVDGDGDPDALGTRVVRNTRFNQVAHGLRVQFGTPVPGSSGMRIVFGETGPFRAGSAGEIRVRGALGGAQGFFALGFAPLAQPALGGLLLIDPLVVVPIEFGGVPGAAGTGSWSLPFVFTPELVGNTFFKQAGAVDPGSPLGISSSNALMVTVGN